MPYIYNDEDNAPMNEDAFYGFHNTTVYKSLSEMKAWESWEIPFGDPPLPEKGCWNCEKLIDGKCSKDWNNGDDSYYDSDRDDKHLDDSCDEWEFNPEVIPEDLP